MGKLSIQAGDDDDDEPGDGDETKPGAKKKNKKKKKRTYHSVHLISRTLDCRRSASNGTNGTPMTNGTHAPKGPREQTNPPSIPISDLYPDGNYPEGEILEHPTPKHPPANGMLAVNRLTSEEKRMRDLAQTEIYRELRQAAECHRQTRKWVMSWIEPGMKMIDIW